MSQLVKVMQDRHSVRVYDPNFEISREEILDMLKQAATAPSSSNLQPWRFMVIQDQDVKKELRAIAYNQEQVETASAVIAVLGDSVAYKNAEQIYTQNVQEGLMAAEVSERMIASTTATYSKAPVEVLRSIATFDAGLISMQLMLIAKERGYDTVAMGGFDKVKFAEHFKLEENVFPVILLAVGKAAGPAYGSSRMPIEQLTTFI